VDKITQADGRYEQVPATPYQRLLGSSEVSDECKAELKRRKGLQDPIRVNNGLNRGVEKLLKLNREKARMKQVPAQEAGQAEAV
jgi:hypothetical protein